MNIAFERLAIRYAAHVRKQIRSGAWNAPRRGGLEEQFLEAATEAALEHTPGYAKKKTRRASK